MEQQFGLETYITQNGKNNGVYISFPTTRKAIRRAFKKAHIPLNDWKVAALKTGSDAFSKAVFECRNLDELNLLGYWMSQFSEEEYYAFFDLCDAGCAEGQHIADFINLAANYHNIFCLKDITDEVVLGRRCIEMMAKAKPEEADEIREEMAGHEEELGLEYAAFRHGHIFENVFYGRRSSGRISTTRNARKRFRKNCGSRRRLWKKTSVIYLCRLKTHNLSRI